MPILWLYLFEGNFMIIFAWAQFRGREEEWVLMASPSDLFPTHSQAPLVSNSPFPHHVDIAQVSSFRLDLGALLFYVPCFTLIRDLLEHQHKEE
jgi:hypothetical protein